MWEVIVGILVIIGLFFAIIVATGVRIVQPYQKGVVERLGKYKETVNPGLAHHHPVRRSTPGRRHA